jgi:hypothetical protein
MMMFIIFVAVSSFFVFLEKRAEFGSKASVAKTVMTNLILEINDVCAPSTMQVDKEGVVIKHGFDEEKCKKVLRQALEKIDSASPTYAAVYFAVKDVIQSMLKGLSYALI